MADGRHIETGFIAVSRESSDFNEIWCRDEHFASKDDYMKKGQNVAYSKWQMAAILKIVFWLYLNDLLSD